jgi:hypothetical protein
MEQNGIPQKSIIYEFGNKKFWEADQEIEGKME